MRDWDPLPQGPNEAAVAAADPFARLAAVAARADSGAFAAVARAGAEDSGDDDSTVEIVEVCSYVGCKRTQETLLQCEGNSDGDPCPAWLHKNCQRHHERGYFLKNKKVELLVANMCPGCRDSLEIA